VHEGSFQSSAAARPFRHAQSRPDKPYRLAVGSFIDDYANKVELLHRESCRQLLPPLPCCKRRRRRRRLPELPHARLARFSPALFGPGRFSAAAQAGSSSRGVFAACLPAVDEAAGVIRSTPALTFQHPYPPTKVAFIPDKVPQQYRNSDTAVPAAVQL
jgi:hypothetical protein